MGSETNQQDDDQNGTNALIRLARRCQTFLEVGTQLSKRSKSVILAVAAALLVAGVFLALKDQPDILHRVKVVPALLLLFVALPVTILINSLEFQATARLLDLRIGFRSAVEITTIGWAANLLPVPGGAMSRVAGLKLAGSSLKEGAAVIFLMSLSWIGIAFVAGSMPLLATGAILPGWIVMAFGAALIVVSIAASLKISASVKRTFVAFALKVVLVAWDGIRMYLALLAVDAGIGLAEAYIFVLASVVGSTVTVVPAGLGVREGASALLALAVGLPAAIGLLAASFARLAELVVLLVAGLWLTYQRRARNGAAETDDMTQGDSS